MHKSYDISTGETHEDKFNIDFIRYTKFANVFFNIIGTAVLGFLWISNQSLWSYVDSFSLRAIITINIAGALLYYIVFMIVANKAGNNFRSAARLVLRRGLFQYTIMTSVLLLMLIWSHRLELNTIFYNTVKILMGGQVLCALLAVPLDYLATAYFFRKE